MADTNLTQLSYFDNLDPYPIQVAEEFNFPLQRYEPTKERQELVYSIQDWIVGVAKTDNPRLFWTNLKRRLKKAGIELYSPCLQLPYKAANDKTYKMDFVNGETLYQITQRMDANTGIRNKVLEYLAKTGALVDWERANPEAAAEIHLSRAARQREKKLGKLDGAGYGDHPDVQRLRIRHEGIKALEQLKAMLVTVCTDDRVHYGEIFDAENSGLFGHVTKQLKEILGTDNIRDVLSAPQLSTLQNAEVSLREVLRNKRLSNERIIEIARAICKGLGEHLELIAELQGVDRVTWKPLLGSPK